MLTLTFLGVGGAFARRNFHSNALVEVWTTGPTRQGAPDDTLLIDFGSTGPLALHELKDRPGFGYLNVCGRACYPRIRRIFISHQHADHIGGLEDLALMNTYVFQDSQTGRPFKPQLISSTSILTNLWDHSLKGGLHIRQGTYAMLQDYFAVVALRPGEPGQDGFLLGKHYRFEPIPTDHVRIERVFDWPSYGLTIVDTTTGESVFFSGDTRFDFASHGPVMANARLCFHDVQLIEQAGTVHALLSELRTLPPEIKKKTYLYHYGDEWDCGDYDFVSEEFAGFAHPQQRYVLFE